MSAAWVSGGRVWSRVVERQLATAMLHGPSEEAAARAMQRCMRTWRAAGETLGPASGPTAVWEHLVRPCADALGWQPRADTAVSLGGVPMRTAEATLGPVRQLIVAMPWGMAHDGLQRAATRLGASRDTRWIAACNGQSWRWYDAARPYAREHVAIDLVQASIDARVWQALWLLGQPIRSTRSAGAPDMPWLERLVLASTSEGAGAASALRDGVSSVLVMLARQATGDHDAHVMLVFQWLFLLFAESRSLLPVWHPSYRRSYALSSLARESTPPRAAAVGVHESLVAIGRLGREGADFGELAVRALGGPLFSGTIRSRRSRRIADATLGTMLAQLTHGSGPRSGTPIDFAELGVEHLGSLYERLVSPPVATGAPALLRKRTGAFYTPRVLADMLVERTLEPLVRGASSNEILGLRILDPAMGSGALLASALRYLVAAVETAWVREGRGGPLDVSRSERESLPRCIAEQCLYGVDVNARAVDVARLSLWLLSMAPDRPLTWLDAHLRVGNSLVGTSPSTILSRLPGRDRWPRRRSDAQLTLFDLEQWHHEAAEIGPMMEALVAQPTESAAAASEKSLALASLRSRKVLAAWRARADAWCGAAMDVDPPSSGVWRSVDEPLRAGEANGTDGTHVRTLTARWQAVADAQHCLHWSLEFPEMFENGRHGFDAVIANPPWEMLRGDLGSGADRSAARHDIAPLLRFVRRSGLYREAGGHVNSYQLFLERMLQLVRPAGRLGCLLPGGMLVDHGAAALRRHVLDRASIDHLSIFDNRDALFPIHRSVRIVAMTGTSGSPTEAMLVDDGVLARSGARPDVAACAPRLLPRTLLRQGSGDLEAVPWLRTGEELQLLEHLLSFPRLGGAHWHLRFGRELNATDDRALLRTGPVPDEGLGVVDGKHLQAFSVSPPDTAAWISTADACRALPDQRWRRWRLAYRDVSSATNRRSLIAALLPPACVSTHTLFCLRCRLALPAQLYLCGMLNSLAADWFVRRYLAGHVTTRLIANLPVPKVAATHPLRRRIVRLSARLMRAPDDESAQGDLHAVAATLYALDAPSRAIVASDFPRLPEIVRERFLRGA